MGLDALALILIPSYCVHANWIGPSAVNSARTAVETYHAMAAFICILVVGSILSINPKPLAKTFPRVVTLVLFASIAALCGGAIGGLLTGSSVSTTLFSRLCRSWPAG